MTKDKENGFHEHKLVGEGPFFTYKASNGRYGLSMKQGEGVKPVGLAIGAIYETREEAIAAGLLRITHHANRWRRRCSRLADKLSELEVEYDEY